MRRIAGPVDVKLFWGGGYRVAKPQQFRAALYVAAVDLAPAGLVAR